MPQSAHRRARAVQEAGEWLLRLQAGELQAQESEAFVEWLRESPVHVAEMLRVSQLHEMLVDFNQWDRVKPLAEQDLAPVSLPSVGRAVGEPKTERAPKRRITGVVVAALAASVLALVIGVSWWKDSFGWKVIRTDAGERREVVLTDGSVVQVGPGTRLLVRMEERRRSIVLERGDALFRVAKDKSRPFVVDAEKAVIRAVGTAFGVERQGDSVVVTVSEGRVAVTRAAPVSRPFKAPEPLKEVALSAGQQLAVAPSGEVGAVRKVDSQRELAWAEGKLVFFNDPVSEVVRQFNRNNRIQIRVLDEKLAGRPVSGIFDSFDPESFAAFLESAEAVSVTRSAQDEILIRSHE